MMDTAHLVNREALLMRLKQQLSSKRLEHVLRVEEMAIKLATLYQADVEKASIAALLHDYAKELTKEDVLKHVTGKEVDQWLMYRNEIWHGPIGAILVKKEFSIHDPEILKAISIHTTGDIEMSLLDKVIFVADYIEAGRTFPGVIQARNLALLDINQAVFYKLQHTLIYLSQNQLSIYPKSVDIYNAWSQKIKININY